MKLLGIVIVALVITDKPLIRFFALLRYWRKKWEFKETVH
jgi:hypothetical protein